MYVTTFMLIAISIDDRKDSPIELWLNQFLPMENNYCSVTIDRTITNVSETTYIIQRWFTRWFRPWISGQRCAPLYEWPRYRNAIICLADREIALLLASLPLHFTSCIIPAAPTIVPISFWVYTFSSPLDAALSCAWQDWHFGIITM